MRLINPEEKIELKTGILLRREEKKFFYLEENKEVALNIADKAMKRKTAREAARKAREEARNGKNKSKIENIWKIYCELSIKTSILLNRKCLQKYDLNFNEFFNMK